MEREIKIALEHGHYVAYVDGVFFCTADTYIEAVQELKREGAVA